jgi:hypothetical protein
MISDHQLEKIRSIAWFAECLSSSVYIFLCFAKANGKQESLGTSIYLSSIFHSSFNSGIFYAALRLLGA